MPISQIVTNSIANANVTAVKLSSDAFSPQIFKPSITSPTNNATDIIDTQLITATPYLSLYGIAQANAQWQISTSPTFAYINVNSTITGSNTQFQVNSSSGLVTNTIHYARVRYSDTSNNSSEYSNTVQFTTAASFSFPVDYLVVAGGGGGGDNEGGGGGGGGGFRTGTAPSINVNTNFTVTVGAGGNKGPEITNGSPGGNSVFNNITSTGGGGGGGGGQSNPVVGTETGRAGGSGGGSSGRVGGTIYPGGAGNSPPTSPSQGNPGGFGYHNPGSYINGGGGGGASSAGTNSTTGFPSSGGPGGNGAASTITGSPVTYAGGGAGGSHANGVGGTGGPGGGANGQTLSGSVFNATANLGGGGGGAGNTDGSNGGSGVVILRYPNARTISNPGGGLTFTTSPVSSNTVATFTAGTGNVSWS